MLHLLLCVLGLVVEHTEESSEREIPDYAWGGRQARGEWTAELFYWDFSIGHFLTGVLGALTLGSLGSDGQTFMENLSIVDTSSVLFATFGGVIWNMANVFLSSAISVAGMSVAFPIGGGLGWIGGIVFNFVLIIISGQQYSGNLLLLWGGVIWMNGMVISFMGSGAANPAISYALSNASPVIAILWGLFVWKEFNKSPRLAVIYIKTSFILFIIGLICISLSH